MGPTIKINKMILSKNIISKIKESSTLVLPQQHVFELPEKVLQFGTGVLLRGLPDFQINQANNQGLFNGRIVVIKSTAIGMTDSFNEQDGLYTVCIRGIENGEKITQNHVVASVSRVLSATNEWTEILQCAANPDMQVILSNTTEVGITLIKDNVHASPPQSFPGKLLAFLYQRFKIFNGDVEKGMVIIPTELIPANADKLLSIVLELAHQNGFEIAFIDWLENANYFCNSLVDRIVPGKFSETEQAKLEEELGYQDSLTIMSENYALWAIQSTNEKVKEMLSFATTNNGIIIAGNISKFRELKLRLLNGSHTFSCGLAFLAGFDTVKAAMADENFALYITGLMKDAIIPSIVGESISTKEAHEFANKVLDRYRNPFIEHHWINICVQYSSKMFMRNILLLNSHVQRFGHASPLMSLGMAAHILFMRCHLEATGKYYGILNEIKYPVTDENAEKYIKAWNENGLNQTVASLLGDEDLWQENLNLLTGFTDEVIFWLQLILDQGASFAIHQANLQNTLLLNEK
jgi:tagaturonate reductase